MKPDMISVDARRRECQKTAYTRKGAKDALAAIASSGKRSTKPEHHMYECKWCGHWHLSSHSGKGITDKEMHRKQEAQKGKRWRWNGTIFTEE